MTYFTVVRRNPTLLLRLQAMAEKCYIDGMDAAEIAVVINDTIQPQKPVTLDEVEVWIRDGKWIRRPEPRRGQRITPEPPPRAADPWEPMFQSWMQ